jgi:putative transposase
LRTLLSTFIDTLMSAEADALCGAPYGVSSPEPVNSRNGYRLLERRKRAEAALTSVVATCYLLGVSTRRMEKLVESLGITRLSKSQVSTMAADLDAQVQEFRTRTRRRRTPT